MARRYVGRQKSWEDIKNQARRLDSYFRRTGRNWLADFAIDTAMKYQENLYKGKKTFREGDNRAQSQFYNNENPNMAYANRKYSRASRMGTGGKG